MDPRILDRDDKVWTPLRVGFIVVMSVVFVVTMVYAIGHPKP